MSQNNMCYCLYYNSHCLSVFLLDRQQCALWIKKLCDPAACGSGLTGRKNRNMYARLLVQMLKRGVLELPFTSRPEPGSLKTLPTYMARTSSSPVGFSVRPLLFSPHRFKSYLPLLCNCHTDECPFF